MDQNDVTEETQREAIAFANSLRGNFITAKALYFGIKSLDSVRDHTRESSDLKDMQFMFDNLFPGLGRLIENQYNGENLPREMTHREFMAMLGEEE